MNRTFASRRFSPPGLGFLIFLLDKKAREPHSRDEPEAAVPTWRTPQPAPHWHEDHEINLVVEGTTRYRFWNNGEETVCHVAAGEALLLPGGVLHTVEVERRAMVRGLWVHPERIENLRSLGRGVQAPFLLRDAALWTLWNTVWEGTGVEYQRHDAGKNEALEAFSQLATLGWLRASRCREVVAGEGDSSLHRVESVRAWMERHALELPDSKTLARRAGMSPSRFGRLFKSLTGRTPSTFLLECRLNHARQLLETTRFSASQIGDAVGFSSSAAFSHAFTRFFGFPPGACRARFEQENAESKQ